MLISKDVKRGLFYPIRIFFHSLKFENAMFFSLRDHSVITADAHACERNVWVHTPFPELFCSLHIKLRWKTMKPNIKVERISLLLARIHHSSQNGKLLLHFSRNLVAARRSTAHVRKFTKSPYTSLKLDYLRIFNKLFCVDDKERALQHNSIKRQSVSSRVSKYTWNNKEK